MLPLPSSRQLPSSATRKAAQAPRLCIRPPGAAPLQPALKTRRPEPRATPFAAPPSVSRRLAPALRQLPLPEPSANSYCFKLHRSLGFSECGFTDIYFHRHSLSYPNIVSQFRWSVSHQGLPVRPSCVQQSGTGGRRPLAPAAWALGHSQCGPCGSVHSGLGQLLANPNQ
ncbi:hypothetical protein ZEAMMB73_Zm00001d013678 [Zea mays]|uniref:Uncharacterized protein n=1 Tax=Zea mays TaxID=4577 RepID=A0A1Q0ZI78_MAIZE|nr:hypothetical protein ZEAMMB73_Zm00001d013678 [Zea mays]